MHIVGVDLQGWIEQYAARGIEALERLLDKHARFQDYLKDQGR